MKLLRATICLSLTGFLAACVSVPQPVAPQTEELNPPPTGEVATASMGEHLLDQGRLTRKTVLELKEPITGSHQLRPGVYGIKGRDDDKQSFSAVVENRPPRERVQYVAVYHDEPDKLCMVTIYSTKSACYERDFVIREQILGDASYRQTIVYTGLVGDRLRLSYREYADDMERPSVSNDVEYDLTSSTIISYRGAQLEVIEASNEEITYKVLRGFDDL